MLDWHGYIGYKGRAIACVRNKRLYASRLAYELFVGPIPEGLYVLHFCDNARCINPQHLHVGTLRTNANERTERNRTAHGSKHYHARLTESEVRDILRLFHKDGLSQQHLAKQFNVSFVAIHNILYRETWKHVLPGYYPPPADGRKSVTEEDVRLLRILYQEGATLGDLASRFCIGKPHVWRIVTRRAWAHIP